MRNMTNVQIYNAFKHGENLSHISIKRIYSALKANDLQVVLVKDINENLVLYNFVPEIEKFEKIKGMYLE